MKKNIARQAWELLHQTLSLDPEDVVTQLSKKERAMNTTKFKEAFEHYCKWEDVGLSGVTDIQPSRDDELGWRALHHGQLFKEAEKLRSIFKSLTNRG